MSKTVMAVCAFMFFSAASLPASALFESDSELAREARISMVEAITTAQKTIPGQPIHVEMGKDSGKTVYQIQMLDKDNKTRWVYVDTMTGAVTEAKR